MYYVYVLISLKDNKLYIGWTPYLRERLSKHNKGLVKATKGRRPLNRVHYEAFLIKKDSLLREKYLKTGWGRRHLKSELKYSIAYLVEGYSKEGPPAKNSG